MDPPVWPPHLPDAALCDKREQLTRLTQAVNAAVAMDEMFIV
jgi:hypothetical protein